VGDDQLDDFTQQCLQALAAASQRQPIYFIHGNRDFLIGQGFAHTTGTTLLADPTVLCWGNQRTVLSHGDLLCTDDTAYQEFRTLVRSTQWQNDFLAKPLAERQAIARHIRHQSETKKRETGHSIATDVNTTLARQWLALARATTLVHGHTHLPADHPLVSGVAGNLQRLVLSDWDLCHSPPRAEVLRWHRTANASAALSTRFERASLAQAQTGRPTP
jgi:UDP-2,3-diacylglucosamine hydrolase